MENMNVEEGETSDRSSPSEQQEQEEVNQENVQIPIEPTLILAIEKKEPRLWYDSRYACTKNGLLKILGFTLCLLAFICIQCSYLSLHSTGKWFSTVTMCGVWITGILILCYLFHLVEVYKNVPWVKFEFFYCAILALCLLTASLMTAPIESSAFQAGAFFGFSAIVIYAIDAIAKFRAMRIGAPAQGKREIIKPPVIVAQ